MPDNKLNEPTLPDVVGNPDTGNDSNGGIHSRATDNQPKRSESPDDKETSPEDKNDTHKKDVEPIPYNKVELIGSVSEYATKLLEGELKKIKRIPMDTRIVVVTDKDSAKGLIPLVPIHKRKFGVYHNQANHLPLFNRAVENWCHANDIPISSDMGELLRLLGGV